MSQTQVSELMAHVKADTLAVPVHRIDDIRQQHDILQRKDPIRLVVRHRWTAEALQM